MSILTNKRSVGMFLGYRKKLDTIILMGIGAAILSSIFSIFILYSINTDTRKIMDNK